MSSTSPRRAFPFIPTNIWWRLRERFVNAPPKGEVTRDYLSNALGLGTKVAANVMPSIRQVGLIDDSGRPTELARRWRDDATYSQACREVIENVYPNELRDVSPPDAVDFAAAQRWFLNETGAGAPRARQLAVFYAMLAEAELNGGSSDRPARSAPARAARRESAEPKAQGAQGGRREARGGDSGRQDGPAAPTLSVAIQVYVDKNMTAEQVDHVFASMAKHLYGRA